MVFNSICTDWALCFQPRHKIAGIRKLKPANHETNSLVLGSFDKNHKILFLSNFVFGRYSRGLEKIVFFCYENPDMMKIYENPSLHTLVKTLVYFARIAHWFQILGTFFFQFCNNYGSHGILKSLLALHYFLFIIY